MNLKSWFSVLLCCSLLLVFSVCSYMQSWAGEKEELTWKAKALLAELELRQTQVQNINQQIIELSKELEGKGLMYDSNTKTVVQKPKPKEEKK